MRSGYGMTGHGKGAELLEGAVECGVAGNGRRAD